MLPSRAVYVFIMNEFSASSDPLYCFIISDTQWSDLPKQSIPCMTPLPRSGPTYNAKNANIYNIYIYIYIYIYFIGSNLV